jgi:hypothetical protein
MKLIGAGENYGRKLSLPPGLFATSVASLRRNQINVLTGNRIRNSRAFPRRSTVEQRRIGRTLKGRTNVIRPALSCPYRAQVLFGTHTQGGSRYRGIALGFVLAALQAASI